jgi:hypothetical protein
VTPDTVFAVLAFRKLNMLVHSEQLVSLVNLHDPDRKVTGCRISVSAFLHLLVQSGGRTRLASCTVLFPQASSC